ncbi:hypothetical protein L1987_30068 [Smallanthus sonchifolius]|uniref:Uncharacterized protein n=1 Tax=Smallanthus sonchifolius TaxID=185202 RepID=A0ACB9I1U5_9ASTR|nr:hypothetical protein L1987_30068 [Smallanthus sonchifolius]
MQNNKKVKIWEEHVLAHIKAGFDEGICGGTTPNTSEKSKSKSTWSRGRTSGGPIGISKLVMDPVVFLVICKY